MQGKTINGFELKKLLGIGGMAEVWYAENEIGMKAAVKILSEELSHNAQMKERFLNEAKVMVQLDHPNIRKVHGYGSIDGRPAIIMEYLDGSDLKTRMKHGQHFTNEELKRWWNQMVDALNYTHAQDIVHRDIKPSNIFIDQKDNAKLLDFGIAKVADTTSGTLTGSTLGTRIYMSPEQVKDPKRVGTPSDSYSLAVSFVHLLTGKAPYDSTTSSDYDIQVSIVTKPVDLSKVPAEWQGFLKPFLDKDANRRPALKHFEAVVPPRSGDDDDGTIDDEKPVFPKPPHSGPAPLSPTPIGKPGPKKGLWIGIAAAAVVALLVFLLWPKNEPIPTDPDTQSYEACQTVADYRAYMRDYGRNALHYAEAMAFVDQYVADSMEQELQRKVIEEAKRVEDSVYMACITIIACDNYLKAYPEGRFVTDVQNKIIELENNVPKNGLHKGHEYVDLGLPSGTLWATCNVGASKPEDYGHYYAWGEINPKDIYNWYTYQYSNGGTSWEDPNLTKYCSSSYYGDNGFIDNLTTLQSGDDPATNQWGSGWRTPSMAQWAELRNNTKHEWPTRNGVQGVLFTSKKNDQTLFLPAAGTRMDSGLEAAGFWGEYLSRSIFRDGSTCVWTLYFNLDDLGLHDGSRVYGYSVRPVRHK
ncbi:MAG: serine/threonine protein kinase [Bacteroidales bacterium]|nr:serine/threonine protein kinase [Bacteroidales bacterium]